MIGRSDKEKQVGEFHRQLQAASAAFLLRFEGMDVQSLTALRKDLKSESQAEMKVYRNTLMKQALKKSPEVEEGLKPHLNGSSAFVFAFSDPSRTAKVLFRYMEDREHLQIKTGVMKDRILSPEEVKALATLPSQEVLRGRFLAVLQAPLSRLLAVCTTPGQALVRVLSGYKEKQNHP